MESCLQANSNQGADHPRFERRPESKHPAAARLYTSVPRVRARWAVEQSKQAINTAVRE